MAMRYLNKGFGHYKVTHFDMTGLRRLRNNMMEPTEGKGKRMCRVVRDKYLAHERLNGFSAMRTLQTRTGAPSLRVCKRAGVPHWHPHQLRHTAATELRKKYGVEMVRAVLGYAHLAATEIYAEVDARAMLPGDSDILY